MSRHHCQKWPDLQADVAAAMSALPGGLGQALAVALGVPPGTQQVQIVSATSKEQSLWSSVGVYTTPLDVLRPSDSKCGGSSYWLALP